jgi:hypothetical protein
MIFRFDTVECIRNTLFDDFLQLTSEAPTSRSEIDALLFNYGEPANSQPLGPHPAPNLIHFFLKEGWILSYRHAEHYYHIFGPWARQQVKLKERQLVDIRTKTLIRVMRSEITPSRVPSNKTCRNRRCGHTLCSGNCRGAFLVWPGGIINPRVLKYVSQFVCDSSCDSELFNNFRPKI